MRREIDLAIAHKMDTCIIIALVSIAVALGLALGGITVGN